jgi:predicted N-formylglutamate amidohydrolase
MYLGPHDPPPYSVFNEQANSKLLFVCDHSGRAFPARLNQLGLADWVLDKHVAWDIGSGDVAHYLATRFEAPLICSNYSRLVVDNNRHPEDPEVCITLSEGIAIPGNMDMSAVERERRFESIFDPYHAAIERQLNVVRDRGMVPALVAIHSCTPVFDRVVRPWHIGVLWDKDPRIAVPLLETFGDMDDVCVGDNEPYSGRDPHDYTIDHHGEAARIPHVSIEVRQDLIDTPEGAERWAGVLGDALEGILADEALYSLLP